MVIEEIQDRYRALRMTSFVAAMLAIMLVGVPSFLNSEPFEIAGTAAAEMSDPDDRKFVLGVEGELGISTLNPHTYTMMYEAFVIFPCYSGLLQYDMNNELIGDVAYEWSSTPDKLTWYFKLYPDVYFCDPDRPYDRVNQLTAEDVIYSYWEYQLNNLSRLHPSLPYMGENTPLIKDMGLVDDDPLHMYIELNSPYAPFLGAMSLPILPKYYWEAAADPLKFLDDEKPIGSGPFFYNRTGSPDAGSAELYRNPIWHGEDWCGWQNHVDVIILTEFLDEGSAWQALKAGDIDVQLTFDSELYLNTLFKTPGVTGFAQSQGFVYEFNLNQLSDEMRRDIGGTFNSGENNQLLLIEDVREAFAMCIDKGWIVSEVLNGLGSVSTSLVPDCNPWLYEYGSTEGEVPFEFDLEGARAKLWNAGWKYDALGNDVAIDDMGAYPLYRVGGTDPLEFDFISPSGDEWRYACHQIVNWTRAAGIKLDYTEKSVMQMNTAWYAANYDVWLWDWVFGPLNDPSTDCLCVLTTDAIGVDSDIYWSNETFDNLYAESLVAMDPSIRYDIVADMQRLLYEYAACQALAYRKDLYGVSTQNWMNFGDWNSTYALLPDNTMQWSGMLMSPTDNEAPTIESWTASASGDVDVPVTIQASASDDEPSTPLQMRVFWGDLERSEWIDIGTGSGDLEITHPYTEDGQYTAYIAVKENGPSKNGILDNFITWKAVPVTIRDLSNAEPVINSVTLTHALDPSDPDTGTVITFECDATDEEGDPLFIAWEFGDGRIGAEAETTHQYLVSGPYEYSVSVTDNHIGANPRPTVYNGAIYVGMNHAPTISVPSFVNKIAKKEYTYTVDADDEDGHDVLTYTWHWGDGTPSTVTSAPSADHTYNSRGEYELTVYVDDNTGVPNHNVSDHNTVYVTTQSNKAPVVESFVAEPTNPYTFQDVLFTAEAYDPDGDGLRFTFEFDDDAFAVVNTPSSDQMVSCEVTYAYLTGGSKSVYVHVSDGVENISIEDPVIVTVTANDLPQVNLPVAYASTNVAKTFAVDVDDDDVSLKYTWIWGDGATTVTTVNSASHTYTEGDDYVYRVWVDDSHGHNVSDANWAYVNTIPELRQLSEYSYEAGAEVVMTAYATDADEADALTYMWVFGDSTPDVVTSDSTVTHTYSSEGTFTRTVYVWDGFEVHIATHNVSSSVDVTVLAAGVNYIPEVDPFDDVYGTVGEPILFTAYASDPNGDDLKYTWEFGDSTGYTVGESVYHTYMADAIYPFLVHVDDGSGDPGANVSAGANAILAADEPPVALLSVDSEVDEDETVVLDGSDSTDDVRIDEYTWTIKDDLGAVVDSFTVTSETTQYIFEEPGAYTVELVVTDSIGQDSDPDSAEVTVLDVTPPEADAGADIYIDVGGTAYFDGSGSTDNVAVVSYEWTFMDGTWQTLTGESPSYAFDTGGVYGVTLTVEDAAGNSDTDTMTVRVGDLEDPVADAGEDQSVDEGTEVQFDGSGSDDDVGIVNYTWTFTYDDEDEELYEVDPTFTFDIAGEYTVTLTVTDAADKTGTDDVVITVSPTIEAPVADAGPDQTVEVGTEVTFDGSGSSDDSEIVNYTWTFTYDGEVQELYDADPVFTFDIVGTYDVTLTVEDDDGETDTDEVVVTVTEVGNEAPVADAGDDRTVTVGTEVTFDSSGSADDSGIVNFTWTFTYDGETQTLTGASPKFVFDVAGVYVVTLTVEDAEGETDTDTVTITVEEDDGKSFLETYGLPIGALVALIVVLLVVFFVMKSRKGKATSMDDMSAGEPETPSEDSTEQG